MLLQSLWNITSHSLREKVSKLTMTFSRLAIYSDAFCRGGHRLSQNFSFKCENNYFSIQKDYSKTSGRDLEKKQTEYLQAMNLTENILQYTAVRCTSSYTFQNSFMYRWVTSYQRPGPVTLPFRIWSHMDHCTTAMTTLVLPYCHYESYSDRSICPRGVNGWCFTVVARFKRGDADVDSMKQRNVPDFIVRVAPLPHNLLPSERGSQNRMRHWSKTHLHISLSILRPTAFALQCEKHVYRSTTSRNWSHSLIFSL